MSKPQHAPDPSVEEMLSTIRRAIDEETARTARDSAQPASVSGSMREMRISLQPPESQPGTNRPTGAAPDGPPARGSRPEFVNAPGAGMTPPPGAPAATTRVSSPGRPFSGIMGGDVRLEEALARLQRAERRQEAAQVRPASAYLDAPAAQPARNSGDETHPSGHRPLQDRARPDLPAATPELPARPQLGSPAPQPRPAYPMMPPNAPPRPSSASFAAQPRTDAEIRTSAPAGQGRGDEPQPYPPRRSAETFVAHRQPCAPAEPVRSAPALIAAPSLLSQEAEQAATNAFARLSEEMLMRSMGGNETLTGAARDMLRPMLKAWLDENLPSLVERLVREEIERVVRRGGH